MNKRAEYLKKPPVIAFLILLLTAVWVMSGQLGPEDMETPTEDLPQEGLIVEAEWRESSRVTSYIIAQGSLEPDREVTLRAETSGRVTEILVPRGERVTADTAVIRLATEARDIQRERARLRVEEARRQLEAAERLRERGYGSQTELDAARSALKLAEVELEQAELEVRRTLVRAPFEGIIEERMVELGDFVSVGGELLRIVDIDPLVVSVQVPQARIQDVSMGEKVMARLVDGRELQGQVRYISARANPETRTFRVEVEIPNEAGLRSGSSATARIPREEVEAHFISSALLSLNEAGTMGVKTLDGQDRVVFHPVTIERSESDGMWVSGLPRRARLIISGQGFARIGERVTVSGAAAEEDAESQAHSIPVTGGR